MSDLVERLNQAANKNAHTPIGVLWNLCDEAADEIERLRGEIRSVISGDWSVTGLQEAIGDLREERKG
mgnify:CR=1 FL=1